MSTSTIQDNDFWREFSRIYGNDTADICEDACSDVSWILEWVADYFTPDDLFCSDDLESWADEESDLVDDLRETIDELNYQLTVADKRIAELEEAISVI